MSEGKEIRQNNIGNVSGYQVYGGVNTGNIINISGNLNTSATHQTIADAAREIQTLLEQLEQTNPTATEDEQVAYVSIATRPDFKKRVIASLQESGEATIDEFILSKYLKVVKMIVKEWLSSSG